MTASRKRLYESAAYTPTYELSETIGHLALLKVRLCSAGTFFLESFSSELILHVEASGCLQLATHPVLAHIAAAHALCSACKAAEIEAPSGG
jgi:hypothetical protein